MVAVRALAALVFSLLASACTSEASSTEITSPPAAEYRSASVDEGLDAILRAARTRGFSPDDAVFRGFALEGTVAVHEVSLASGSCYAVLAAGSSGLRALDVALFLSDGTEGAHGESTGGRAALVFCAVHAGPHYVTVRAREGSGLYGARVARGPTGLDVTASELLPAAPSER